jgi:hypothetical protein
MRSNVRSKACIIKRKLSVLDSWPDRRFTEQCHTHELTTLLILADLETDLNAAGSVAARWLDVKDWTEQSRYEHGRPARDVNQFYQAIADPNDGVLQWLKACW